MAEALSLPSPGCTLEISETLWRHQGLVHCTCIATSVINRKFPNEYTPCTCVNYEQGSCVPSTFPSCHHALTESCAGSYIFICLAFRSVNTLFMSYVEIFLTSDGGFAGLLKTDRTSLFQGNTETSQHVPRNFRKISKLSNHCN